MKIYRIANLALLSFVLSIVFAAAARTDDKVVPGWDPAAFRDASTIKIMTTEPDVGEHWSNLWVVIIDGQPYVRLGDPHTDGFRGTPPAPVAISLPANDLCVANC
jgi:hypothetical protein